MLGLSALLGIAVSACASSPAPPAGVVSANLRSSVYQDDDRTTVATNTVSVGARPSSEWTLGARYLVDVTSSASVDVVSSATGRYRETRQEVAGSAGFDDGTTGVSAGYVHSRENDWQSHTGSAGVTRDLDQHGYTVGLGGSFTHNRVGRASDPTFHREQLNVAASAQLVLVASPRQLWSLNYVVTHVRGYQASPYRYARLRGSDNLPFYLGVPEVHPERRLRHAGVLRHNAMLGDDAALRSHARLYLDDWGVKSLTLGTELRVGLGERFEVGGLVRLYGQLGATFYRDVYQQSARYMTADRELSPFVDAFAGPRLAFRAQDVGPFRELRWEAKVLGFAFYLPDFSRLETRYGVVVELALGGDL